MRSNERLSARPVRARRVIGTLLVGLLLAAMLAACKPSSDEQQALGLLNQTRQEFGVGALADDDSLQSKAHDHAVDMANSAALFHTELTQDVRPGWTALGENVGVGYSLDQVNQAFQNSPDHRDRRLSTMWNAVGVGVARDAQGRYWVVEEFGHY
jgi:uncharacterized protein YkwD